MSFIPEKQILCGCKITDFKWNSFIDSAKLDGCFGIFLPPSAGMSPNPGIFCQKGRISARYRVFTERREGSNRPRSVKKRAAELSVWNISPLRRPFSCGKNKISLRKEIFFLPQSREFLAAKKFPGVWKAGKNGASGGFFLLIGDFSHAKSICPFAGIFPIRLTRGRHPSARRPAAGGKMSREPGFRLSSCIPAGRRDSRISVRPRTRVRPRDSRGAGFDVLTKWNLGFPAALQRMIATKPPRGRQSARKLPVPSGKAASGSATRLLPSGPSLNQVKVRPPSS